jgi:hypothetical protein
MKTSEMINEISKAMSLAQGEMKPASKSTVNPFFKSTYASLAQVMDSIREPFSKNNLCVFQDVCSTETGVAIHTRISHASGQWIEFGPLEIPLNKKDAQAVGSATSYGKRYSLSAAVGVVSDLEDDDGERAMNRNSKPEDKKKELISQSQAAELLYLFDKCDADYCEKLKKYLSSEKIINLEKLPLDMFEKVKAGILKNVEVNKEKLKDV